VDQTLRRSTTKVLIDRTVAIVAILFLIAVSFLGEARAGTPLTLVGPNDMQTGSLLLKADRPGKFVEAPRVASDYAVIISGPTARTTVTQRFENPADGWIEGVYVFPLPENSAVDSLKIIVGNRVIVGEVKARLEAKIIYETAKSNGESAALLEQERPNIFTNSIANIGPHETVIVQITYQETVKQSAGTFSLRLPLVVAPRYSPDPLLQSVDISSDGFGKTVEDTTKITPPILNPAVSAPTNPTTITITLNAGFELGEVQSLYHQITTDPATKRISLAAGQVPADKDFALEWRAKGAAPQVGLFQETIGGRTYLLGFVTPPATTVATSTKSRETIFVIDNSGSMDGPSMVQAKASLIFGLSQLKPADRFNVIRFDDTMSQLFSDTVPADQEHINQAKGFVDSLQANGGTEMLAPMIAALKDAGSADRSMLRQVVFITDGEVTNEAQLFAAISQGKGRSRVFMVGIGAAPNTYLMTRAAELGRGTFTQIGVATEVVAKMQDLYTKIGNPVVTDLRAELIGNTAVITPELLPDLYLGEPVLLMAEAKAAVGELKISGLIGDQPWEVRLPLNKAAAGSGISKLMARRMIADTEVAMTLGSLPQDVGAQRILAVALAHQIVSSQTSLVAVDKTPKRPLGAKLTRAEVPLNLPEGWNYDAIFGEQKSPVKERDASLGFKHLAAVASPMVLSPVNQQVNLPQGGTPMGMLMIIGSLLMALGVLLQLRGWRQTKCEM
jgi:Ca-activated chloride channel homolog